MLELDLPARLTSLPRLQGVRDEVALAGVLRAGCIAEVVALALAADEATPDVSSVEVAYRTRMDLLATPTDAAWWIANARQGAHITTSSAVHALLKDEVA